MEETFFMLTYCVAAMFAIWYLYVHVAKSNKVEMPVYTLEKKEDQDVEEISAEKISLWTIEEFQKIGTTVIEKNLVTSQGKKPFYTLTCSFITKEEILQTLKFIKFRVKTPKVFHISTSICKNNKVEIKFWNEEESLEKLQDEQSLVDNLQERLRATATSSTVKKQQKEKKLKKKERAKYNEAIASFVQSKLSSLGFVAEKKRVSATDKDSCDLEIYYDFLSEYPSISRKQVACKLVSDVDLLNFSKKILFTVTSHRSEKLGTIILRVWNNEDVKQQPQQENDTIKLIDEMQKILKAQFVFMEEMIKKEIEKNSASKSK